MPTRPFAFVPVQPPGDWSVTLPGAPTEAQAAGIGEVLVYATPAPSAVVLTGKHWTCYQAGLPITEEGGDPMQLATMTTGTLRFRQPSVRDDNVGFSCSQASTGPADAIWFPSQSTVVGHTYALAGVTGILNPLIGSSGLDIRLQNLAAIDWARSGFVSDDVAIYLNTGTGMAFVGAPSGSDETGFVALRVAPGGVWTFWHGPTGKFTGTFPTFALPASTNMRVVQNDQDRYGFQDLYMWAQPTVLDAEIESIRDDMYT